MKGFNAYGNIPTLEKVTPFVKILSCRSINSKNETLLDKCGTEEKITSALPFFYVAVSLNNKYLEVDNFSPNPIKSDL
jgi:hypothetical protein